MLFCRLAARGGSTIGRVPSAAGVDTRRCDDGDAGTSSRSANAADAPAPPESYGRIGVAGNLGVARRQRCHHIASSSRLDLASQALCARLIVLPPRAARICSNKGELLKSRVSVQNRAPLKKPDDKSPA